MVIRERINVRILNVRIRIQRPVTRESAHRSPCSVNSTEENIEPAVYIRPLSIPFQYIRGRPYAFRAYIE